MPAAVSPGYASTLCLPAYTAAYELHIQWQTAELSRSGVQFVSTFTENKADGQQLENVYNRVKQGKSAGVVACCCVCIWRLVHACLALAVLSCI